MNRASAEEALTFDCAGERLVGVLHGADTTAATALVIVVGGPQYRAGSHRQFLQLGRAVAAAGYPVLRFDYRGMGDSSGSPRTFESVSEDIGAAIDALQARMPSIRSVVLWGLCDGASASLLYVDSTRDPRVSGVCALNPWVRSEAGLATTQLKHYYTQRLLAPAFWVKLFRGKVAASAPRELLRKMRVAASKRGPEGSPDGATAPGARTFQQRMARGWQHLDRRLLLILSGNDYTAKEFVEHVNADDAWRALRASGGLRGPTLADADHTFSSETSRLAVERLTIDWMRANLRA